MKTPLVIVLVIVAGMLGFLTIYSQQQAPVAQVTQGQATGGYGAAAPAAGGSEAPTSAAAGVSGAPTPAAGGYGK